MSQTSAWQWQTVNQRLDYISQGGARRKRNNWALQRFRTSDATYSSQLDATASSITASNGGVERTVSAATGQTISGIRFLTTTNWTLNTTTWIKTGWETNIGIVKYPIYKMETSAANIPDGTKTNILLFLYINTDPTYAPPFWTIGGYWHLCCVEAETSDVTDGSFEKFHFHPYINGICASQGYTGAEMASGAGIFNGQNLTQEKGTFLGASEARTGTYDNTALLLCTGDVQSFDDQSVNWYRQTQTWSLKDDWRVA